MATYREIREDIRRGAQVVIISREDAGRIMTAEEQGRPFEPKPNGGMEPGVVDRIWYDDDGFECWDIFLAHPPGKLITSRGSVREDLLRERAARAYGVSKSGIKLWCDPTP